MIFISLLLALTPPQTSTSVVTVRAQVAQTCVVTTTRVTCRGAQDRPGQVRITQGAQYRPDQGVIAAGALPPGGPSRITYGGPVTIVEF
jgi:hypothetical protein